MSTSYLFFRPTRLPLQSDELDEETVVPLGDPAAVRQALARVLPDIAWDEQTGKAQWEGQWLELTAPSQADDTLSMRCSLRADYTALVQKLCDELGWLAFDDRPCCFQPGRAPMPA
jgi:hypothetical protein